jgi:hypothetical protein
LLHLNYLRSYVVKKITESTTLNNNINDTNEAIFMLAGGVCWTVSGAMCWAELPCALPAVAGSVAYLVSVACQLYDWFLIRRSGGDAVYGRKLLVSRSHGRARLLYAVDYYLVSSLLFLFGTCGDLFTTYHTEVNDDSSFASMAYLLSSLLWLLSSFVDTAQTLVDAHCRRRLNAVVQISFLRTYSERLVYSWEMAQALTFMIANVVYLTSAGLCFEDVGFDNACYALDLTGGSIFILNALCMMCAIVQPRATDVNPALSLLATSIQDNDNDFDENNNNNNNNNNNTNNDNDNDDDVRRRRRRRSTSSENRDNNNNSSSSDDVDISGVQSTEQSIITKIQMQVLPSPSASATTTHKPSIDLEDEEMQNIELDDLR